MRRALVLGLTVLVACEDAKPVTTIDAATIDGPPPPPSVDAGPAPAQACGPADACELPPSTCLDDHYALIYTAATCAGDACVFSSELTWCSSGCSGGGCILFAPGAASDR